MAHTYGRLTGNRGSTTRTGSKASGMTATVQTWEGGLTLVLDGDGSWKLYRHRPKQRGYHDDYGQPIAAGDVTSDDVTVREGDDDAYALTSEAAGTVGHT